MGNFTYNDTSPSVRDKLRTIIGDTNGDDFLFSDEELNIFLTRNSQALERSAADACRAVAFSAAKQAVIIKLLDTQIDRTEIPKIYLQMANTFERQERNQPIEYWDSFAYNVDVRGVDGSE